MSLSLFFLISLTSILSGTSSAAPPPSDQPSHFTSHRLHRHTTKSPQEYIEVTQPLSFSSLTPACSIHVLSHSFGNTMSLPPTNTTYLPPWDCTWTQASIHFSGSSIGDQYDRIAAVWLGGAEILRTSTPEPTPDGVFWNVHKDITRYSSLLRQRNLTLSVMLENIVNDVYTGVYHVNVTFHFYNSKTTAVNSTFTQNSNPIRKNRRVPTEFNFESSSLDLDENPADLIIPISAIGDEGFWFRIERESDLVYQGIRIPLNTYRAVIEVYSSAHGNDEFWYSNPPDSYIEMNNLTTKRGHGSYREVLVNLDDNVVGSVIPFSVVFTGGINPLFWEPVVSIGAFDLPSYEIELTPYLGLLLDGKVHYIGLGVDGAISFWLVDANLHLWLDHKSDRVQAQGIRYDVPSSCIKRENKFHQLDGRFEVEGERKSELTGWVYSSAGNFTTHVTRRLKFENVIKFRNDGTEKKVEQEVRVINKLRIEAESGGQIKRMEIERKYPLKLTTTNLPGSVPGSYLMSTKLEQSLRVQKTEDTFSSISDNTQRSDGWMFVQEHDVLSGAATTEQHYDVRDDFGCYARKVSAANGHIMEDTTSIQCVASS